MQTEIIQVYTSSLICYEIHQCYLTDDIAVHKILTSFTIESSIFPTHSQPFSFAAPVISATSVLKNSEGKMQITAHSEHMKADQCYDIYLHR